MKNLALLFTCLLLPFVQSKAQPLSYNDFKVVHTVSEIYDEFNNTPASDPIYLILAPGQYELTQEIIIDRIGPVYLHGLSSGNTEIRASGTFSGNQLFKVIKTKRFSLAGLSFPNQTPIRNAVTFEPNGSLAHDFEIQEAQQFRTISINAPGTYRVQSVRLTNLGYIVNHPDADLTIMQTQSWSLHGNRPAAKTSVPDPNNPNHILPGNFEYPYGNWDINGNLVNPPLTDPDDLAYIRDSTCFVWQQQGRVRIYNTNDVVEGFAYNYRFDSRSHLGPHVIAGLRSETENHGPSLDICDADNRFFKAIAKVSGDGNQIIFKSSSPVKSGAFFHGVCAEKIAFVDFQSIKGKAFILGNAHKEGFNKMIMNSANTILHGSEVVLLGNKIASLPGNPATANWASIPLDLYADIDQGNGSVFVDMGNMTRLNTAPHPATGSFLTGAELPNTYGDEVFSDLFLTNRDSIQNAPAIPVDIPPHALPIPDFNLANSHLLLAPLDINDPNSSLLTNVANFGAQPNDGVDDYNAIQSAIDYAAGHANGHSLIYFPPGQYVTSGTLEFNTMTNNTGRSILIAGSGASSTVISSIPDANGKYPLSIFSITNSRLSRMQGLRLEVNNSSIHAIKGYTTNTNPSQAIVAVDNFDFYPYAPSTTIPQTRYGAVYMWNFRDCAFVGGQVGVSTQMRKQMSGTVRNHATQQTVSGIFSGRYVNQAPGNISWGGLGESFALVDCKFEHNNIGLVSAHHQAFCHFVSNCQFDSDTLGIAQYAARGTDHMVGQTGYTKDNAGGNYTILHSVFNSIVRDFTCNFQTQTVSDYFNSCDFNAPTAMLVIGDSYASLPPVSIDSAAWIAHYRRNKNFIEFFENCQFGFDHTQDAKFKDFLAPPVQYNFYTNFVPKFTFVAHHRSSIFCLNSDLQHTTFLKSGAMPSETPSVGSNLATTAGLQGIGYGFVAQCQMPGGSNSTFTPYGSKVLQDFNFDPLSSSLPDFTPPYPAGYGSNPPVGLFFPRYVPSEIVNIDFNAFSSADDYYFWRIGLNYIVNGSPHLPERSSRMRDYGIPMQRILLYNVGENPSTSVDEMERTHKMVVYPNPVQEQLQVTLEGISSESASLSIVDALGRNVFRKNVFLQAGSNTFEVETGSFVPGIYYIVVHTKGDRWSSAFVKIK